jgi:hypothetical protein
MYSKYYIIDGLTHIVAAYIGADTPTMGHSTPPPDFVVEVPDDTIVEVGWTYVPGDTPESFSFVPPVEPEEV